MVKTIGNPKNSIRTLVPLFQLVQLQQKTGAQLSISLDQTQGVNLHLQSTPDQKRHDIQHTILPTDLNPLDDQEVREHQVANALIDLAERWRRYQEGNVVRLRRK